MSTNKKTLMVVLIVLAVALTAGLIIGAQSDDESTNQTNQTQSQIDVVEPTAAENEQMERDGSQVVITNLAQDPTKVYVRAIVNGANSGECVVTLKNASERTITQTAPLKLAGASYTCQGFDVDKNLLPSKGEWTITVSLKGSTKVQPASRQLNVN